MEFVKSIALKSVKPATKLNSIASNVPNTTKEMNKENVW